MNKLIFKNRILILLISIIMIGFFLRAHQLTTWPRHGATFDEYAWAWLGISLIKDHVPSSWSPHLAYEEHRKQVIYQQTHFWVVKPYLEHPPFFGIVVGSFALLNGVDGMFDLTFEKVRPLALILGIISIFALFLFVREIYGEKIALLSGLLYATIPTIAIGSRIVQNENFFIPLFLISLYLIAKFIKTKKTKYRNLVALICGLLIISKIPWVAATLAITLILFYKHKYQDLLKIIFVVLLFFLGYIVYGIYFNSEIFLDLWRLQLGRYDLTYNSIFALFTEPYLVDRYTIDGWIYFGWFAFILLLIKNIKENYIIIFGLLAYFAVFIFAIPNEAGHGWYRYPFYPFLVTSIAIFIRDYFNKNLLLTFFFIILIGASLLELSWGRQFGFSFKIFRLFLISTSLTLLPLIFNNKKIKKISITYNSIMLILLLSLNFWAVMEYNEQ